jgi:hypothetical protein
MFYSRKLNRETGRVEVWECEWSNLDTGTARKEFIRKYGDEGDVEFAASRRKHTKQSNQLLKVDVSFAIL